MAINQTHYINIIPQMTAPIVVHCSQGDVGTTIYFYVINGDEQFDCTSYSVAVYGTRQDGVAFGPVPCTVDGNKVSFNLTSDMTAVKGAVLAEVKIGTVGTANFAMLVEDGVFPLGVTYANDTSVYEDILNYVQSGLTTEAAARAAADTSLNAAIEAEETARIAAVSAEATTRANADESLREAIDAMVSPSGQSVVVDKSLSIAGAAADAAACGDLKIHLGNVTGNKDVASWSTPYYYLNTASATVDVNTPVSSTDPFRYSVIPCTAGDEFTVTLLGGNSSRAYAFTDSSYNVLLRAGGSEYLEDVIIKAPYNSAHLIVNDKSTDGSVISGKYIIDQTDTIEDRQEESYDSIYYKIVVAEDSSASGYIITPQGTRYDKADYRIAKFPIIAGEYYEVSGDVYNWQFQTNSRMPSSGTYRTGITHYGAGYGVAPNDATYLVVACLAAETPVVSHLIANNDLNKWYKTNAVTYQWQYLIDNAWASSGMDGATTNTLAVAATSARNGYMYRCKVTDANGVVGFSNVYTLNVTTTDAVEYVENLDLNIGINFFKQPESTFNAIDGDTVNISVSVISINNLSDVLNNAPVIQEIKGDIQHDINNVLMWEAGNITSDGEDGIPTSTMYPYRIRLKGFLPTNIAKMIRHTTVAVFRYNQQGTFVDWSSSATDVPEIYYFDHATYKYRLAVYGSNNDLSNYTNVELYGIKGEYPYTALARFDYPLDIDTMDISEFDFNQQSDGYWHVLDNVYDAFDALVAANPSMMTKADAAELLGLSYPSYATGGDDTPTYKTYMYTLISTNQYAGNSGNTKKGKMLILGGVHGNEFGGPVNSYLFAKSLIDMSNHDLFGLLSAFDFYFVPCVTGWGMYHRERVNGNGVNINRNYPIAKWSVYGSPGDSNYTGASAGSEFETQLVMGITDYINPDVCIDHHNYGNDNRQFYSELSNVHAFYNIYQALQDCSYAFIKKYPDDFGTSYQLFQYVGGSTPMTTPSESEGKTERWWYERGIPACATVEIAGCINFLNGEYHTASESDKYNQQTFNVGQFTLRNTICHLAEYYLKNAT